MQVAYFKCPMVAIPGGRKGRPASQPLLVEKYGDLLLSDGGIATNSDLPDGRVLVKVEAPAETLQQIHDDPDIEWVTP